jgi:prolipoprotein diacylglyceryl transferase
MYGLMLLAGIAACIALTGLRWTRPLAWSAEARAVPATLLGRRDWDLVFRVAVWGVAAGVVGARIYHLLTSWSEVPEPKWKGAFEIWNGGLGIWGGIFLGSLVGAAIVHRAGADVLRFMDAVAPGLLLAQGIGRWGNWWNQELFGKPTSLPWALRIDPAHRPPGYLHYATFHPTFLYEFSWNLFGVAVLLLVGRRFRIRPAGLFALYVSWYTLFRSYEEILRIDPGSHYYFGLRLNFFVSVGVFALATGFFLVWQILRYRARDQNRRTAAPREGLAGVNGSPE